MVLDERARDLSATAARLGFPDGVPLAEHRRLRVPGEEPLRALSVRFEAASADLHRAETALRDAQIASDAAAKRLDEHERSLPLTAAAADLEGARALRDEAWRAVRLADAAQQPAPVRAELTLGYEARTRALDATVDAVLRHADAVAQLAELRRALDARQRDVTARSGAVSKCQAARDAVLVEWNGLWSGLAAERFAPPRIEQTTFARDHARFIKDLDNLLLDQASFAGEENAQKAARDTLRQTLAVAGMDTPPDASFATLLARLDDRIADGQAHNASLAAARALADKTANDAQRQGDRLETAVAATANARAAFETNLSDIALPEGARSDQDKLRLWIAEGRTLVDQLRDVHDAERALAEESANAADRDAQRRAVLSLLATDDTVQDDASPPLLQTDSLAALLARARETRVLEQAHDKAELALSARQRAARDWAKQWADHLSAAGLPTSSPESEDVERCLERSDAVAIATRDLARQRSLLEAQAGEPLASLRARLGPRSKDDLDLAQQTIAEELQQLEERRNAAHKAAIDAENAFRALGTLGDHDTLRQDHEAALALLAEELAETLTLKGATLLLTELSVELAHTDHRAALLGRTSAYLSRLTGGSFHAIHADDEDAALTVTRTGDDETLGVDALSEGTRDQVYLALRLAVAHRQLTDKRLPFVLDDVLVHFDDTRAAAALGAFAELAEHTQVILFTHHRHLFDVANAAGVPFHAIELPAPLAHAEAAVAEAIDAPKPVPRAAKKPRVVVHEPGPELLSTVPEGAEALLLEKLRELGGSAGNGKLRAALGWEESVYDEVKAALVVATKLELGKGRGGSVKLVEQLAIL